ncbi:aspartate/glutamate racemase family protein [Phaeobacter sp. QD34_3]|uniref:aspartate/glutamate racemase family protein n=1 Tax=unclassified Phaeobacter TaxID=2621772 RepID=UPI00237FB178|nr:MULTISPECIES: aspartate/glutamate racemase family protein [unclassified Phaeobacter]MDE4133919.1 aspartate/glutamate racemase family protein [Phaeobacter sp. QD34_3]MDE4137624.1 aspartate/glutamate racemase family protein [Phaeobacter sp. QD34_24]
MQQGGKTVYGAAVGILMLETRFPRIHGDMGNAATWDFPVQYRVVDGATPDRVVRGDPQALTERFIAAGRDLIRAGCDGITTTCGFLSLIQEDVKAGLGVPVATSSLMQVPMVQALLPAGKRCGVITISEQALSPAHLTAAGAAPDTPVVGTDGGRAMTRDILGNAPQIDFEACRLDMIDSGRAMVTRHPDVGAIVLECTNMAPYARDLRQVTGLPVYSIYSFITWFQAGLLPRRFPLELDDPRW